ncbi:uncharacterized protein V6R79_001890 [Siganus canaliculatus]
MTQTLTEFYQRLICILPAFYLSFINVLSAFYQRFIGVLSAFYRRFIDVLSTETFRNNTSRSSDSQRRLLHLSVIDTSGLTQFIPRHDLLLTPASVQETNVWSPLNAAPVPMWIRPQQDPSDCSS